MRHPFFLLAPMVLASVAQAQTSQLVLPRGHNLSINPFHTNGAVGSIFRNTAGKFVVIFDAQNFIDDGVVGPITINKLRFRGEDTETNAGGQTYANVNVQLGTTSLTSANLNNNWAVNWAPTAPNTTTAAPALLLPTLVLGPSFGTAPNNYNIEIDLAPIGGFVYDPSAFESSLLVEITMPSAPIATIGSSLALIPTQQTNGSAAQIGSTCRSSANPIGASGVAINGPVMNIEFTGAGGYATLIPARVESYGFSCGGGGSSFYQQWRHTQPFDLANTSLTMIPDSVSAPNFYFVTGGTTAPDLTKVNLTPQSIGDDAEYVHALPYTLFYPGAGATTSLRCSTNGYIYLDAGPLAQTWVPTVDKWLGTSGETARFAPIWHDWHCGRNATSFPGSGLHVFDDTTGGAGNTVTYVTWLNVSRSNIQNNTLNGVSVNTFQVVISEATGIVEFRYGNMSPLEGACSQSTTAVPPVSTPENVGITGFTRGNISGTPSVDTVSRDLSAEVPFFTFPAEVTPNLKLSAAQPATVPPGQPGRFFPGCPPVTWNVDNIPAGTIAGALLVDFAPSSPAIWAPGIIPAGCGISLTLSAFAWEIWLAPTPSVTGTISLSVPLAYNPTLIGAQLFAQFGVADGFYAGGDLFYSTSNALAHTLGLP